MRVVVGVGISVPLEKKHVPLAGIKGFCNSKNILIYHNYLPKKDIFPSNLFFFFLASINTYYTKSDCC